MEPEQQDRVVVVLVRARNPSNIGAVARAMHDLGYRHLRVVNEYPVPFTAAKSAVDASSVLEAAQEFSALAPALADCTLVLGTTAVGERDLEHPLHIVSEAATLARAHLAVPDAKVALLFGSEKTGLSNDELSYCHALVTIPMNTRTPERHLSMNLGQAAAVCLYELAQPRSLARPEVEQAARADDLERIATMLGEVLERSGYTRRHPANARPEVLRRLIRRMALAPADAQMGMGLLRQLLHALPAPR